MTEMTDWERWRGSWQAQEQPPHELDHAMARFERAKRRDSLIRVIEWVVVASSATFPMVAIRHAANIVEATLGISAAVIVVSVALFRAWKRRAERITLGASTREFDDAVRSLRAAELRFVRFLWLVLGVEGVFGTVWWAGGLAVHDSLLSPIAVGMLWLPLVLLVAVLVWSIRLRADAARELSTMTARDVVDQPWSS